MQLNEDLTLSTHGTRTVTEFLHRINVIVDELAIIDHPVSNDDLTLYILNGLGPKFREIAAPIRARETSLKFEEIHDLLRSILQENNHKWLVDSTASHSMTTDLSNLSINFEYDRTNEVDRITGAILLKGECEDGVYPFPEHLPPDSKNVTRLSRSRCHNSSWFHAALLNLRTWVLKSRHPLENGSSPTPTPLQIKRHPDGSVDRFKARLVAKGFNQRPRLDYKETFSPIVKPVTIRTVLTLAIMQEKVYMKQPPDFKSPKKPDHVYYLTKAIYGLKQAPRAWYSALK
ncbi:Retrovirus-related Pol polyprotein from transposon RE2 [Vitis vinifera]|uniref:Retrovirus-related Pol polyprotein from transposon RE2 n=1 Tax=Vitis vinifera TaxID=29760 RepID=A0A438D7V1_VITVI|nr:Retrovirus-related Pol polyprotein from transposon RE2 [Vitis vinifera]